jgi:AcrR family transcriptional regulator
MPPRPYDLGRRRASGDATRAKILEAARSLIGGKGDMAEFSMEAVAAKAGVSRMTVYNQFHSQPRLLEALSDAIAERGGMHRLAGAFVEPSPAEAVRIFVSTFVGFWASERLLLRRLRAMGVLVPTVYRKVRDRDAWRREAARNLAAKLDVRPGSDRIRDPEWAADLLAALTSFETFDALCEGDRTPETVARALSATVLRAWGIPAEPGRTATGRPRRRSTGR